MRSVLVRVWLAAIVGGALVSCGSRTGLFGDGPGPDDSGGTGTGSKDGGRDATLDGPDLDALPPIDVAPKPDVDRTDCPDADATFIYVVTQQDELYSFYPPTLTFKLVGRLVCPVADSTPFSMAVDRKGAAFVVFNDGQLFRVSTATAACIPTSYAVDQLGFHTFGMGFASDNGGPSERLYVAENNFSGDSQGLGAIDVTTFKLGFVGGFHPSIPRAELTGTGDGRLFAFWPDRNGPSGSHVAEIEKANAAVIARTDLPVGTPNDAFAFAFWGGDFWIFTSPGGPSSITRFRPSDGSTQLATTHPSTIVGAGVSTCAPEL